ncbi:MAG: TatD family hydrolase [Oscillospiraceae bacterium]|nr:TatD family hydrolase [Oscillospiraceae bacterium]
MYFDTHAHYDDEQFDEDRDDILASMPAGGVGLIVNAASDVRTAETGRSLADKYPFVYFAAGVHPHEASGVDEGTADELRKLLAHPKAVAVGEIGLDYHYDFSPRDVQKTVLREQMELAREVGKPVIIHEREACADTLEILRDYWSDVPGVFHCYSGSWETAKEILDRGWYLSFTGVVTFKNARRALEVVRNMPLDRLMIETDSPYLAPEPRRGRRNDSRNLVYIAARIAQERGMAPEELAKAAFENGKRFFCIQ